RCHTLLCNLAWPGLRAFVCCSLFRAFVCRSLLFRAFVCRSLLFRAFVCRSLLFRAFVCRSLLFRAFVCRSLLFRAFVSLVPFRVYSVFPLPVTLVFYSCSLSSCLNLCAPCFTSPVSVQFTPPCLVMVISVTCVPRVFPLPSLTLCVFLSTSPSVQRDVVPHAVCGSPCVSL
uniref:Uncharacterized protein n=1 Tax=Maylandia zebra TaxID=106582 RepID=A0A3P9DLQ8_9CICH